MTTKHKTGKSVENFNRYKYWSEAAAKCERKGDYQEAAEKWKIAALSANAENKTWASSREEWCLRMHSRPFSEGNNDDR